MLCIGLVSGKLIWILIPDHFRLRTDAWAEVFAVWAKPRSGYNDCSADSDLVIGVDGDKVAT